jgi:hypothetical protein
VGADGLRKRRRLRLAVCADQGKGLRQHLLVELQYVMRVGRLSGHGG